MRAKTVTSKATVPSPSRVSIGIAWISRPANLPVAIILAAALFASGCGGGNEADLENGKALFTDKCGACHRLADAGSQGVSGPDLDDSFRQSLADGMKRSTIEGVVVGQIRYPSRRRGAKLRMPADIVTGDDARDVAAYVADVTAKGESDGDGATGATP